MNDDRNIKAGAKDGGEAGKPLYRVVGSPRRTDGVGEALRSAFLPSGDGLMDEFNALLREIDRRSAPY